MYKLSEKKLYKPFSNDIKTAQILPFLKRVLADEKPIFIVAMIYGAVISLLSLAAPISVQLLINSVSFTALLQPILVLGAILFLMVSFYGLVSILQFYVMEIFQRRFFARMSCEVGMSLLNAKHQTFEESNQTEMVNRFFETVSIQKTIPQLFSKTFTILLQSVAGLILVACYHPFFLIFSFGVPIAVFFIWKSFAPKALVHSFLESRRKFDLAGWLEDIARNHVLFSSRAGREYAKFKIDFLTGTYLKERQSHFRNVFSQVILLFVLYALATALLLIIGGWLVLKGQLSIGQLVASELVISVILYNISNLGRDFESFYDLVASSEKLSQFQNIPAENSDGEAIPDQVSEIVFDQVLYREEGRDYQFNFNFLRGQNYLLFTNGYSTKKIIIEMLLGLRQAVSGVLRLNSTDIDNFNKHDLRSQIVIIDNSPLIEGTLREYLTFNRQDILDNQVLSVLESVGIASSVLENNSGLDLRIIPSGWPFSESEKILLKVARVLIQKPQIIIATEVLDMLGPQVRKKILNHLVKNNEAIFLYFSYRLDDSQDFDHKIFVEKTFSKEISDSSDINSLSQI